MQLTLGEQIKLLRKRKGLSQEQIGNVVDLSSYTVGKIESGETSPRVDQLKLIAAALGVELCLSLQEAPIQG